MKLQELDLYLQRRFSGINPPKQFKISELAISVAIATRLWYAKW